MQTYSLGSSGSLFPSVKHTQQSQIQAKPYASLESHDNVSFSVKNNVRFGVNQSDQQKELIQECLKIGVSQAEIDEKRESIKAELRNNPEIPATSRGGKLNSAMVKWLNLLLEKDAIQKRDKYERNCRSIGVTDHEIIAIKAEVPSSFGPVRRNTSTLTRMKALSAAEKLQKEYERRLENESEELDAPSDETLQVRYNLF